MEMVPFICQVVSLCRTCCARGPGRRSTSSQRELEPELAPTSRFFGGEGRFPQSKRTMGALFFRWLLKV